MEGLLTTEQLRELNPSFVEKLESTDFKNIEYKVNHIKKWNGTVPLFKIRSSATSSIVGGSYGLSDAQKIELAKLASKSSGGVLHKSTGRPLKMTEKDNEKFANLIEIRDNPTLPQGAKTYCDKWIASIIYNRKVEFETDVLSKGKIVEQETLDLIGKYYGFGSIPKNEKKLPDGEFSTGTTDVTEKWIKKHDLIIDAKSSYSHETFPLTKEKVESVYYWQGQNYMMLTGCKNYRVAYGLVTTPKHLIISKAKRNCFLMGYDFKDEVEKLLALHNYDNVDIKFRVKGFDFKANEADQQKIVDRVIMCRKYITEQFEKIGEEQKIKIKFLKK